MAGGVFGLGKSSSSAWDGGGFVRVEVEDGCVRVG